MRTTAPPANRTSKLRTWKHVPRLVVRIGPEVEMVAGRAASGSTISIGAGAGSWVICAGHRRIAVITLGGLPARVPAAATVPTRMAIATPMCLLLRDIWRNLRRMVRTNEYTQRPTVMLTRDRRPHTVRLRANARLRSITRRRNPNIGTVPQPHALKVRGAHNPVAAREITLLLHQIPGTRGSGARLLRRRNN